MNKLVQFLKSFLQKKRGWLFLMVAMIVLCASFMSTENTPPGYTGSPADDKDCSSCHRAKAKTLDDLISIEGSNGTYAPLKTYEVLVNLKGNEKSTKFGFQISPQSPKGKLMGQIEVTDPKQTKKAKGKYLNQTAAGVDGKGEKTWSFGWTAPPKGTGAVTFYGSFLIGGKPEIVYNSTLILKEKQ